MTAQLPSVHAQPADLDAAFRTHRRELTGYCYRMLGGRSEAEDAVQETLVRAWKAFDRFEGRSSLRSWLYRIATNVCLDMLRSPQRRARPMDLGPSTRVADAMLGPHRSPETFVQPVADRDVLDLEADPAVLAVQRESVRLAFVAALQHLSPKPRAALILCDVLRFPAAEVASLLDTTVASVNSALQRARATMDERRGTALDTALHPDHQVLVERYVDAFERYDMDAIAALLRDDVVLSMPPYDLWIQGIDELLAWFVGPGHGCQGAKLVPVWVNGSPGFGNYRISRPGLWEPFAVQVLEIAEGRIVGHHNFLYPDQFAAFGLPPRIEA
jgi:RNA polymerase sigma-70 factor (ECF subfamily)